MPDPRFFESLAAASLSEVAALAGAVLADPASGHRQFSGVATLVAAGPLDVSFCAGPRNHAELAASSAGACFMAQPSQSCAPDGCVALISAHPQAAYAAAADRLVRPRRMTPNAPLIDPSAVLEEDVIVGPGASIGPSAEIGRGTVIGAGAFVGPGVAIGRGCSIGPGAVIGFALIGDHVRIYAGAVIGEAGFGAAPGPTGVVDLPQLGRVILQDGVTVGANSCIDRGAFEDTVVGENTKIDNLVQIAHNVIIGRNCVLAAHTGISGSTVVGDGCMFGGRAGVSDHVTIGRGARIAAAAGVTRNVPPAETWAGAPARPMARWLRETALLARLARQRPGVHEKS
jgi:UDP-3-O-[3-hydroxymyristoyl] glucosamine N-acyltransferase